MNLTKYGCVQSWDYAGPQEEAGPSGRGRNLENDLSSAAGVSRIGAGHGTKTRGKGKASASIPSHNFEEKSTGTTTVFVVNDVLDDGNDDDDDDDDDNVRCSFGDY